MSLPRQSEHSDETPSESLLDGTARRSRDGVSGVFKRKSRVLPILLAPSSLRPVVFRTFTKKHNLTVTSASLQSLATFVGKNCGAGWREEGLAEPVLDEIAKCWKKSSGGLIVEDGQGVSLKVLLQNLENNMSGGKIIYRDSSKGMDAASRMLELSGHNMAESEDRSSPAEGRESALENETPVQEDGDTTIDPRRWIKIVDAFEQPRFIYNVQRKHFELSPGSPSLLPPPNHKAALFRDRYHVIYQRLLHNEAFQTSPSATFRWASADQRLKLSSIANLQGRNGSSHLLLGLLSLSPTGDLSLVDPTGTTALDLRHAKPVPEGGAWFAPGMIVLVDGVYEDEELTPGHNLVGSSGVGGTIGGNFLGFSIAAPPCERREATLGMASANGESSTVGRRFGWTDFLGVGSECIWGSRMRRIEKSYHQKRKLREPHDKRSQIVVMSEVNLDNSKTGDAVKTVLNSYSSLPDDNLPAVFIITGNFVSQAAVGGQGSGGSIEYKEYFNSFASVLSEYTRLLRRSTFIFVPGDNDLWSSSFSAGATTSIPTRPIPEMFTSRIQRVFNSANSEFQPDADLGGKAIWTTNPTRLSIFGPVQELVVFRDDISGRLRRSSLKFQRNGVSSTNIPTGDIPPGAVDGTQSYTTGRDSDVTRSPAQEQESTPHTSAARKLVKTLLDQGCLSPFPLSRRPVLWDYASSLQLYPLPTALILADPEMEPFTVTYEGCHVMNPGRLVQDSGTMSIKWIEYDMATAKGRVCEKQGKLDC